MGFSMNKHSENCECTECYAVHTFKKKYPNCIDMNEEFTDNHEGYDALYKNCKHEIKGRNGVTNKVELTPAQTEGNNVADFVVAQFNKENEMWALPHSTFVNLSRDASGRNGHYAFQLTEKKFKEHGNTDLDYLISIFKGDLTYIPIQNTLESFF